MVGSLLLAGFALRAGLALRRARAGGGRAIAKARARHLRIAKPAVVVVLAGFVAGPLSMFFLRGHAPFATLHALLGTLAASLFLAAAVMGHRLEEGSSRAADAHGLLGVAAFLAAAGAAIAGFVLLP
jgi:hypothetical protein